MSGGQFRTVSGRWKDHVAASGIDKTLPRREQAMAMLMFYAGFSAALDAAREIADYSDDDAVALLQGLEREIMQVEALASRVVAGVTPS